MNITTKFDVGDTVYLGRAEWTETRIPCKRCAGSGWWTVVAHSGEFGHWQVTCQVCKDYRDYGNSKGRGTVKRGGRNPVTRELTIGSVRVDTHKGEVEYMCEETGVGSGQIWHEKELFSTHHAALTHAESCVKEQQTEATAEDEKRDERNAVDEMHHCTRPYRVRTVKVNGKWSAWIEDVLHVRGYATESKAIRELAEQLAPKV